MERADLMACGEEPVAEPDSTSDQGTRILLICRRLRGWTAVRVGARAKMLDKCQYVLFSYPPTICPSYALQPYQNNQSNHE